MQILKDRIRKDGKIKAGNVLKVDSLLSCLERLAGSLSADLPMCR